MKTEAWILDAKASPIRWGVYNLPPLEPDNVLVEPIYASWEANMGHAVDRNPIDICKFRNEDCVVIGNAGVVRVIKGNPPFKEGDICLFAPLAGGELKLINNYHYLAHGYDRPKSIGLLAKQSVVRKEQLFKISANSNLTLKQWAAFSIRYPTAWANWYVARKTFEAMKDDHRAPQDIHVWAWGGGVSLATLQLARRDGFNTTMLASRQDRLNLITAEGIRALDRSSFINLDNKKDTPESKQSEKDFLKTVDTVTHGEKVSIFVELIGESVVTSTLKALSLPGVITTSGWKSGAKIKYNRAVACMGWQAQVNTHYANSNQVLASIAYAEEFNWAPPEAGLSLEESPDGLPNLIEHYRKGLSAYFPLIQMNAL